MVHLSHIVVTTGPRPDPDALIEIQSRSLDFRFVQKGMTLPRPFVFAYEAALPFSCPCFSSSIACRELMHLSICDIAISNNGRQLSTADTATAAA